MRRILLLAYAITAWLGFLAVVVWAITFLASVDLLTTVDRRATDSTTTAALVDLALLGAFAVHHSVMARPSAKRVLKRVVPAKAERSTYVLVADLLLALVLWQWRSVPHAIWHLTQPWTSAVWVVFAVGWLIAIGSTFMIDHFDLVGLRQVAARAYAPPQFQVRWLYRLVRHPLMLGLVIAFWATPTMSVGHLLFAVASTGYIAVGVWFEERDLRSTLGEPYAAYARRTPAVIPGLRFRRAVLEASSSMPEAGPHRSSSTGRRLHGGSGPPP